MPHIFVLSEEDTNIAKTRFLFSDELSQMRTYRHLRNRNIKQCCECFSQGTKDTLMSTGVGHIDSKRETLGDILR